MSVAQLDQPPAPIGLTGAQYDLLVAHGTYDHRHVELAPLRRVMLLAGTHSAIIARKTDAPTFRFTGCRAHSARPARIRRARPRFGLTVGAIARENRHGE